VSDISLHFPWPVLLFAFLLVGWPGFLAGGVVGALLWPTRRILGALAGALLLDVLWAALAWRL
jgi:hypothetical protein